MTTKEVQVYRLSPKVGKYYYTTTYTRREGKGLEEKYYTTHPLKYVGQFQQHYQYGYGDGATHYDVFKDGDKEIQVYYTYEGTTCFLEVEGSHPQVTP